MLYKKLLPSLPPVLLEAGLKVEFFLFQPSQCWHSKCVTMHACSSFSQSRHRGPRLTDQFLLRLRQEDGQVGDYLATEQVKDQPGQHREMSKYKA